MKTTITEVYKNSTDASAAVDQLHVAGIPQSAISVLMSDKTHGKNFDLQKNTKAPEGIAVGATTGGVLGAIAAGLTAVGTVALTGGAGIIATGPLVAALAGMGAGAGAGGIIGGLVGLGFNENEAKQVDTELNNGSVLVSVEVENSQKHEVKDILKHRYKKSEELRRDPTVVGTTRI